MAEGLPYDSDEGRALRLLTASWAERHMPLLSSPSKGPFAGYHANAVPFAEVMENHREQSEN